MPGAPGTHIQITPQGVATYVAGSRLRFDLSQLASLQGPPPRKTYLRQLTANVDESLSNGAGSTQTITVGQLYTIFQQILMQMQGHQYYNFVYQGGASIRQLNFLLFGKNSQLGVPTAVQTWAATGSGGANTAGYGPTLKFILPFYDPRGISPEDGIVPVGQLVGSYIDFIWCPANQFGSNFTISTVSTKIRSLTAELIQRDEVRFAPLVTWEERRQSSNSDFVTPEGVLYKDIDMVASPAAGQTSAAFTAANLTSVVFTQAGLKTVDNLNPADVIGTYNANNANSQQIPDWESGTADILPLQYLPQSSKKITHLLPDLNKPYLQLTGAINPQTDYVLLLQYVKPMGPKTVADLAAKANQPLPAGYAQNPRRFAKAKGAMKQPVAAAKSQFLPQKVSIPRG